MHVHTDTVTIVRTDPDAARDDFGDPVAAPVRIPIAGCVISGPRVVSEEQRDRDLVSTERIVHVPAGGELPRATDELELPGEVTADGDPVRWRVHGDPGPRRPHPFTGHLFAARVVLRRTEG